MTVYIRMGSGKESFSFQDRQRLQQGTKKGFCNSSQYLFVDNLNITIVSDNTVPPTWGVVGYAPGPNRMLLRAHPDIAQMGDRILTHRLSLAVAHEVHHCKRWRNPGYGWTLGEALVTEGLAQVFETETGHPVSYYAHALEEKDLRKLADRALPLLGQTNYNHHEWFFGSDDGQFPNCGGYSLGYAIVRNWLDAHGTTAAQSVSIRHDVILKAWREGKKAVTLPGTKIPRKLVARKSAIPRIEIING